jgi:hypothetical protein
MTKNIYSPVNVYPCVKVAKTLPASISAKERENERNCKQLDDERPLLYLDSGKVHGFLVITKFCFPIL